MNETNNLILEKLEKLENKITTLSEEISKKNNIKTEQLITNKLQELTNGVADRNSKINELTNKWTKSQQELENLQADMKKKISQDESEIKSLNQRIEEDQNKLQEKENDLKSSHQELKTLRTNMGEIISQNELEIKRLNQRIEEYQNTLSEKENDLRSSHQELETLRTNMGEIIFQNELEIKRLNQRIEEYQNTISEKENEISLVNYDLNTVNDKVVQYSQYLSETDIKYYEMLIKFVQSHNEYANEWSIYESTDNKLERLIANLSQWDNIERLWDNIANRCKESAVASSIEENQLLSLAIKLFNMTLLEPLAKLSTVNIGDRYDYEIHQKHPRFEGDVISEVLLNGLIGSDRRVKKVALVATKNY